MIYTSKEHIVYRNGVECVRCYSLPKVPASLFAFELAQFLNDNYYGLPLLKHWQKTHGEIYLQGSVIRYKNLTLQYRLLAYERQECVDFFKTICKAL